MSSNNETPKPNEAGMAVLYLEFDAWFDKGTREQVRGLFETAEERSYIEMCCRTAYVQGRLDSVNKMARPHK